jgi:hypothetical protein
MTVNPVWIDRLYTHFLGRDLSYLVSGGFVIVVYQWSWIGEVSFFSDYSPRLWALLVASYMLGLILSEVVSFTGVAPKDIADPDNAKRLTVYAKLPETAGTAMLAHQRTIALMHLGAGVAGGTLASLLVIVAVPFRCLVELNIYRSLAELVTVGALLAATGIGACAYTRQKNGRATNELAELAQLTNVNHPTG